MCTCSIEQTSQYCRLGFLRATDIYSFLCVHVFKGVCLDYSLLQVLFELARFHAPSTIFMDELESIMGQRSGFGAPGWVINLYIHCIHAEEVGHDHMCTHKVGVSPIVNCLI